MTERPFSSEEFTRLLSLPADHPERREAEESGRLDAWRRMLREFESPGATAATEAELAAADEALAAALAGAIEGRPATRPGASAGGATRSSLPRWLEAFLRPSPRWGFAAAVLVVAFAGFWWTGSRAPRAVRSGGEPAAMVVESRSVAGGALELSWAPVPGADGYEVRFIGGTLEEVARIEGLREPRLRLERGAPPAGLASGEEVMIEVSAMRGGDAISAPARRSVRLP